MTTILAIDDEPKNLKLIRLYLADVGYEILTATNGAEGWQVLIQNAEDVDVILLDRMMPVMDGMAFLAKLKEEEDLCKIPVIMQTAAAGMTQVAEGIQAGVFYYLTKPYTEEVLVAIVNAALHDATAYKTLREETKKHKRLLGLIERSDFIFHSLEEARDLTVFLANFFPTPERTVLGLSELLINAVEHGNLGITYEQKTALNQCNGWEAEVRRRLALPEYAAKRVRVHYEKTATEVRVTIGDEGEGFDWRHYSEFNAERAVDNHGRGIALARAISFDEVQYHDKGNRVTCLVRYEVPADTPRTTGWDTAA